MKKTVMLIFAALLYASSASASPVSPIEASLSVATKQKVDEIKVFAKRLHKEGKSLISYGRTTDKSKKRYRLVQRDLKKVYSGKRGKGISTSLRKNVRKLHRVVGRQVEKFSKKRKRQYEAYANGVLGLAKMVRKEK